MIHDDDNIIIIIQIHQVEIDYLFKYLPKFIYFLNKAINGENKSEPLSNQVNYLKRICFVFY